MTAVVDASVLAEVSARTPDAELLEPQLKNHAGALHIPHLAIVETASVIRGWMLAKQLDERRAGQAISDLADFPATRWQADALLPRIWQLRHNLTTYDATYVALAESLDGVLLTRDAKLRKAIGRSSDVGILVI